MDVVLTNIAHVPDLEYHFSFLPTLIENGRILDERPTGVISD